MPDVLLDSREFKIALRPDRPESYRVYWELVKRLADRNGFEIEESHKPFHERVREVSYLDTADYVLKNNGFLLRKRLRHNLGKPLSEYELTLKFRDTELVKVFATNLRATRGIKKEEKFEDDINFLPTLTTRKHLLSHHSSGIREIFSHDNSICLADVLSMTFGGVAKIFPGLKKLACASATPLTVVNGLTVVEHTATPGFLNPGRGAIGEITFSAWYEKNTRAPLVAEFSCRRKIASHEHRAHIFLNFFNKLRTYAPDWLAPNHTTKANFVYGWRRR